jgi:PAS domain S-box-containing protein
MHEDVLFFISSVNSANGKIQPSWLRIFKRLNMQFQYTPYALPVFVAALIACWIAYYGWRHRAARNALLLSFLSLALTQWLVFYTLQLAGANLQTKVLFGEIKYIGIATTPLLWLFFAIRFSNWGSQALTRRWMAALAIVPALTSLIAVTTRWHGLFWVNPEWLQAGAFSDFNVEFGPWYWVHVGYSYLLILAGTMLVFGTLRRRQGLHRRQAVALIISVLAPWLGNILYFSGFNPIPYLDLTPFAFTVTVLFLTWAILGFRLVELAPIARDLIVDEMKDGMVVIDAQGLVVDVNPAAAQMVGISASRAIGKSVAGMFAAWPELVDRYRSVTDAREEIPVEDGRWFELQISPLYDRYQEFLGRVIILRDITARKEIENAFAVALEQAREASRLKSHLLARVSHELRTPLGGILGFAELLQMNSFGELNPKQAEFTEEIIESTNYLRGIIDDLLDQAQLGAETLALQNARLSLEPLFYRLDAHFSGLASAKGLGFEMKVAPDLPKALYGDEHRLEQVFTNLLENAVKFTDQGQVILDIRLLDATHWVFAVFDTGRGISAAEQEFIFEPFRQVDDAITSRNRGTGLGLSITKQLVELMKGQIRVESQPGQGSTFTVTLPLVRG